ncbi:MAG: M20 family metallopeptidase, partial [Isosphaeraceae bacterium]
MNTNEFQAAIARSTDQYIAVLRNIIEMESPSGDTRKLLEVADFIKSLWQFPEIKMEEIENEAGAKHLVIRWLPESINRELKPWLVVGHFDTVWPVGTLEKMPFRLDGNKIAGPGTYDMKADLIMAWLTVRQMQQMQCKPSRPVVFLFTCDEETGSHTSLGIIEQIAQFSHAALVLEPPMVGGALKTARKGVGCYRVEVTGRSAHAGVEPEKGRSAILELANQIIAIQKAARPDLGTTINIGKIGGGSANNVVAENAWCEVDVRVSTMEEAARIDQFFNHEIEPVGADIRIAVSGGLNRPPMVRSEQSGRLFEYCCQRANEMGVSLQEGMTGGGSDGNFTSAAGCPTLDGLGLEG